jgi:LysR family transcriptional regulator, flagellar master operon regulator
MDIDLARTFIDIVRTGSFHATADRLHITQTTVTARIQNLELQLGCRMFVRNRAGAQLTDDGKRFMQYAQQLVQTWEAALRDLPLPKGMNDLINVGAEVSLANPLMLKWAMHLRAEIPTHAIHVETGEGSGLLHKLELGLLHAALVYRPEYGPGTQVEQILEEKLIQVASVAHSEPYVYVDWGPDFRKQHDVALPDKAKAAMSFNLGPLALQYLLHCGGSGYFRSRVVQKYLEEGVLRVVPHAPQFSYPVYLVYCRDNVPPALQKAFDILRRITTEHADWSQRWDALA